ncbi:hypothetical protein B0H14DRAFT_2607879 [Mycena olivaceomarginata]|nr:hypothetical protein B0H14DRAFT_2607879 [Mycena olivaceomarginata]
MHRVQIFRDRVKLPAAGMSKAGTELTTETLLQHEHGGGLPGEAKIMVRTTKMPKQINSDLGSSSKKWAISMYMTDIKSAIVASINIEWLRNNTIPIDESTMTLGDFYAYYSTPSNAPMYLQNVPSMWRHFLKQKSSPFICLEMDLDLGSMQKRLDNLENNESDSEFDPDRMLRSAAKSAVRKTTKQSRTESTASVTSTRQPIKQPRTNSGVPASEFGLSACGGRSQIHKQSEITFKKIICITTVATGECKLIESGDVLCGNILDKPFASGSMKHAYDVCVCSSPTCSPLDQYVAKRFYQLETDAAPDSAISLNDNRVEVESKVIRLAQGKWFLDASTGSARAIRRSRSIQFADGFLAIEIKKPSKASGVASIPDEQEEGLIWIVERKRPTTVIKFGGTLIHHSHCTDLRSATISAFAHFVYGHSNKSLVSPTCRVRLNIVKLRLKAHVSPGTPSRVKGKDGLVLFDLMTHIISEDSGVGNFGLEGIKTFLDGQKCSKVCSTLGIEEQYQLSLPDAEDEDGDGCLVQLDGCKEFVTELSLFDAGRFRPRAQITGTRSVIKLGDQSRRTCLLLYMPELPESVTSGTLPKVFVDDQPESSRCVKTIQANPTQAESAAHPAGTRASAGHVYTLESSSTASRSSCGSQTPIYRHIYWCQIRLLKHIVSQIYNKVDWENFYWSESRTLLPAQQPDMKQRCTIQSCRAGNAMTLVRTKLWHMAGLSPNLTEAEVFDSASRTARLCAAFFHFGKKAHTTLCDRLYVYGKDCSYVTTRFNKLLTDFEVFVPLDQGTCDANSQEDIWIRDFNPSKGPFDIFEPDLV